MSGLQNNPRVVICSLPKYEWKKTEQISQTTCDACNTIINSDIARMDKDNREVLCPNCYARDN